MNSTTMSLECAMNQGIIRDDVKELAAGAWATIGLATFRGIVRCACGTPVPLHIETYWRGQEPTLLRASIGGEQCPDCGAALSPSTVIYRGIYSPGWPFIPATPISSADLYHAMDLMEAKRRDTKQASPSSTDALRTKHEAEARDSGEHDAPNVPAYGEAKSYNIEPSRGVVLCVKS